MFTPMSFIPVQPGDGEIVATGGPLSVPRLLEAYSLGIFPWYEEGAPILWWSPNPRAIMELSSFHVPRSLARTIRSERFEVTINQDFLAVIEA